MRTDRTKFFEDRPHKNADKDFEHSHCTGTVLNTIIKPHFILMLARLVSFSRKMAAILVCAALGAALAAPLVLRRAPLRTGRLRLAAAAGAAELLAG